MKAQQEVLGRFALAVGTIVWFSVFSAISGAASSEETAADQVQAASYEILAQHRINLGNRSIFYNLVSQPIFPERSRNQVSPPPLSPLEQEQSSPAEVQKDYLAVWIFADIYNHRISELYWGDSNQYRAFSNVDFNLMNGETIETTEAFYSLFVLPSNANISNEALNDFSSLGLLNLSYGGYLIDNSGEPPPPEDLEFLNAVHAYYDAHKPELLAKYRDQEEKRRARAAWLKANPPAPKDTVINFWPIKNSAYLETEPEGGAK